MIGGKTMFGLSYLKSPSHFLKQSKKAISLIENIKIDVSRQNIHSTLDAKKFIKQMDEISNELCLILDPAALCSAVHPIEEWRTSSNQIQQDFGGYLHELNTNETFYQKLKETFDKKEIFNGLKEIEKTMIKLFKRDMEINGGAHLKDSDKLKMIQLQQKIDELSYHFSQDYSKETLNDIVSTRSELSYLLEYPSYSHLFLATQMLKTPEEVEIFLIDLLTKIKPQIQENLKELKITNLDKLNENEVVQLLSSKQTIDFKVPIQIALEGLFRIVKEVFGLKLINVEINDDETWHPSILKFQCNQDDKLLGYIYLDLFTRENKLESAATSTIQLGKYLSNGEYQIPSVCLIFGFHSLNLSHSQLTTLFHEFGHALHSLLARTEFQHTSGTRTSIDFVEFPSQFMENFVNDSRFLDYFGKDNQAFKNSLKRKQKSNAITTEREILRSLYDLKLFSGMKEKDILEYISQYSSYKFEPYIGIHLTGYGSGYYSYLYSKSISQQFWFEHFHKDPFKNGSKFLKILEYGASKDPKEIIKEEVGNLNGKYLLYSQ